MFAVIKTGGKQYRVAADETITVMSLAGEPGETVTFGDVLMVTRIDRLAIPGDAAAGAGLVQLDHVAERIVHEDLLRLRADHAGLVLLADDGTLAGPAAGRGGTAAPPAGCPQARRW